MNTRATLKRIAIACGGCCNVFGVPPLGPSRIGAATNRCSALRIRGDWAGRISSIPCRSPSSSWCKTRSPASSVIPSVSPASPARSSCFETPRPPAAGILRPSLNRSLQSSFQRTHVTAIQGFPNTPISARKPQTIQTSGNSQIRPQNTPIDEAIWIVMIEPNTNPTCDCPALGPHLSSVGSTSTKLISKISKAKFEFGVTEQCRAVEDRPRQ